MDRKNQNKKEKGMFNLCNKNKYKNSKNKY